MRTFDQQRQSRFEYQRCATGHGRLTSFFNFLREKGKSLSITQRLQMVRYIAETLKYAQSSMKANISLLMS